MNIGELVKFHRTHGKLVTMSAYNAGQRFGVLDIDSGGQIREFREKTRGDGSLINIGFMVCQPEFIDYIEGDATVLEKEPLQTVAEQGQLMAYKHGGFWGCMDTVREKENLEAMWANGKAPWKVW
ncbi:Glucose-1-phosphate cytidylyltransferase [Firmicutes bacterium ASF500]|nr:Glucose-1-phosphate cytidylyltransferase [Firmicutes bacterium ASF500]